MGQLTFPGRLRVAPGLLLLAGLAACLDSSEGDFGAPTVEIVSPVDGAVVSGVVNVTAEASDDTGIKVARFYVGNTLLGEDEIAPYSWLWDTSTRAPGPVALEVRVEDRVGNTAFHRITVTVE